MNRDQKRWVANQALRHLTDQAFYWVDTTRLYHEIKDLSDCPTWFKQSHLRDVLAVLREQGTIARSGEGKFRWKTNTRTWNHLDPLGVQAGCTPLPGYNRSDDDDDPPEESPVTHEADWIEIREPGRKPTMSPAPVPSAEIETLKTRVRQLEQVNQAAEAHATDLAARLKTLTEKVENNSRSVKTLKIDRYDGKVIKLEDVTLPKVFDRVLSLARCRRNILLVGPAGCGKSTLAELVAKSLGLDFYKVGGSGGLSEEHLLGYSRPNLTSGEDKFISTQFLDAFEKGGVCLVDELDGANENALLALNPALDKSGKCPVPNRDRKPVAKKHKDFVCIGTANTHGRGADRKYVGRNQLDEATLDRFRIGIVECDYDPAIEAIVCPHDDLRKWCQEVRKKIRVTGLRRIMSTRFMEDAYTMVQEGGWTVEDVKETFFEGWSQEERARMY